METMELDGVVCCCEVKEDCAHLLAFLEGVLDVLSEESSWAAVDFPRWKLACPFSSWGSIPGQGVCEGGVP